MFQRVWSKGNTPPLLVRVQTCIINLNISMAVSQKIENQSTSRPSISTLGHIPKGRLIILHEHLLNYVQSNIILNSQNLETVLMPLNKMDTENVVYLTQWNIT